jgi:hypothetical protein
MVNLMCQEMAGQVSFHCQCIKKYPGEKGSVL